MQGRVLRIHMKFLAKIRTLAIETLPVTGPLELAGTGRARLGLPLPCRPSVPNVLLTR